MKLHLTDPDAAAAVLADEYTEVSIHAPRGRPFGLTMDAFQLPRMRYGELTFSEAHVRTRAYPIYNLCVPVGGAVITTADDTDDVASEKDVVVISPGSRIDARYPHEGIVLRTVQFDIDLAMEELSGLLGRSVTTPPRFDFAVRSAAAPAIRRAVAILHDEFQAASPVAQEPALADRLGRVIISALLLGHVHSQTSELQGRPYVEGPRAIRTLVAQVQADPMRFVTVGQLAAAAGLSVRALQDGFQRHVGTSPMQYVKQTRLAKTHADLLAADPTATTATAIAHRWGFAHYGRFAAEYRKRYGVPPASSLGQDPLGPR